MIYFGEYEEYYCNGRKFFIRRMLGSNTIGYILDDSKKWLNKYKVSEYFDTVDNLPEYFTNKPFFHMYNCFTLKGAKKHLDLYIYNGCQKDVEFISKKQFDKLNILA